MTDCTYCGSDLAGYDPVWVEEGSDDERTAVGGFCNYACLHAHIEGERLVYGTSCAWSPDGTD
ncbi:hypothetical protein [Halomarina oriensis]|uniref:MYM-type domain-containing protein n=1 Tax=Halomarina oriensis TaxID=671145 RepID=A0A6B0GSQ9_9EURY|nr:hypothetical protein [Halomarina oriensis]MWG34698.1 hypothetical protein [Halomarina oriensis]